MDGAALEDFADNFIVFEIEHLHHAERIHHIRSEPEIHTKNGEDDRADAKNQHEPDNFFGDVVFILEKQNRSPCFGQSL